MVPIRATAAHMSGTYARALPLFTMIDSYCSITGETTIQVSAKTRAPLFSIKSTIRWFLSMTPCAAKT